MPMRAAERARLGRTHAGEFVFFICETPVYENAKNQEKRIPAFPSESCPTRRKYPNEVTFRIQRDRHHLDSRVGWVGCVLGARANEARVFVERARGGRFKRSLHAQWRVLRAATIVLDAVRRVTPAASRPFPPDETRET